MLDQFCVSVFNTFTFLDEFIPYNSLQHFCHKCSGRLCFHVVKFQSWACSHQSILNINFKSNQKVFFPLIGAEFPHQTAGGLLEVCQFKSQRSRQTRSANCVETVNLGKLSVWEKKKKCKEQKLVLMDVRDV